MAFQKKYYYQFVKLKSSEVHLVELWQNTGATLTAEEVKGGVPPFTIEMPELNHKFQVVRGTGCQINLISESDMKFFDGLYHVDPQEFMVKKYTDGVLSWIGYLNSEMYSEPYDQVKNYQISVTGNDGFALMDRFSFLQTDESNYTGIKSQWEILNICLSKIGLPWAEIRVALSTTFTGYSGDADSTILHETFVNCANFYDEDNKPMSLREVVESILQPYGAYIRSEDTYLYITDIHMIASNSSVTYKRFTYSTGAYVADISILNEKTISSIGYNGTGHLIEMSGGFNRQVVAYSPYAEKEALPQTLAFIDEFSTVPVSFSTKDGYNYRTLEDSEFWGINPIYEFVLNPPTFEESYYTDQNESALYLRYSRYGGVNTMIASLKINKFISVGNPTTDLKTIRGAALLITGEILVKTRNNPYDENEIQKEIQNVSISARIKIGSEYFTYPDGWTTSAGNILIPTSTGQNDILADTFVPIGENGQGMLITIGNFLEIFPLGGDTVGEFDFEIWSEYTARSYNTNTDVVNHTDVKEIWLRNLAVEIVDINGAEISDTDKEYIGLLNKKFQNEGEKITLTCGSQTVFADRGRLMWNDSEGYHPVILWDRNSQSGTIEELLLVSLSSNYSAGFVTLTNMRLKSGFKLQTVLTDSFISGRKLMVKSAVINYHDDVIECSLIEISPDNLTIIR